MFKYVWHARGVRRIRLESYAEDIVLIISCNMKIVCARLVVLKMQRRELELGDMLRSLESKAMKLGARLW